MGSASHRIKVTGHPGSSREDIENEPDWGSASHEHRVGYHNRQGRIPGVTHSGDEKLEEEQFVREALKEQEQLEDRISKGQLINFRDVLLNQEDFHLRRPDVHSAGWRYVVNNTEEWIKYKEDWPANIQKRRRAEEAKQKEQGGEGKEKDNRQDGQKEEQNRGSRQEHEMRRESGENKYHEAYPQASGRTQQQQQIGQAQTNDDKEKDETDNQKLSDKYSPQEIALLRSLEQESEYVRNMKQNNGKGTSPVGGRSQLVSIDEADQFSPDNWIPRSEHLVRLTGKHPLNAEPELTTLFEAGLITPNELHYVRNHGAVPHLLWETHTLDIGGGKLQLSMDDLKNNFPPINIPVALACDGNRRKELNLIRRSKGFNWGAGAVSCAYWKGPLLRDVLLSAGIHRDLDEETRYWVNFEGADELSEGRYATSIPLDYAMDKNNDVILAYEMNDVPLPPDHGHPVRLVIPGYVGGRCVKWLKKIWISDKENASHYHIWDNRVLPSFITETDGEFAETMFAHPDTACNEQNLNSVIVKPAHGERLKLTEARKGKTYRVQGYAYDGGGHAVQGVEVSLDGGETWLYCVRNFPKDPIRHGNKFWTWLHWHVDIEIAHFLQSKSLTVRCFNVFKNTQPERPRWNVMGMMNNCWYVVKPYVIEDSEDGVPSILFRHPCEPGTGTGGWMKPSTNEKIAAAKEEGHTPQRQFTRQEIEKHDKENDCWIVVDGKVYDATSVLSWHPGGKAAVLGHAGKVHQETTDEFNSIHDDYANAKLQDCVLGVVTEKTKNFIKSNAEAAAAEKAKSAQADQAVALQKHRWVPVRLKNRQSISPDTRQYTFSLPDSKPKLGLSTCQHIQFGFHFKDKMLIRPYTPTSPILSSEENGTFDLVVKTYLPDNNQPGGAMTNILDCIPLGEEVEVKGPTGGISYLGNGKFKIEDKEMTFRRVTLILGGSGITPGYQLICRILKSDGDKTEIRVIDANKSEGDILLKDAMDLLAEKHKDQFKITYVLSHPSDEWKGIKGHVDEKIIKENGFAPDDACAAFLCGPPAMIQKAVLPTLTGWGYKEDENCFGF